MARGQSGGSVKRGSNVTAQCQASRSEINQTNMVIISSVLNGDVCKIKAAAKIGGENKAANDENGEEKGVKNRVNK